MILTRQDLSDEENLRRCRWEFAKAFDALGASRPFKLAEWALDWGEAALDRLEGIDDEAVDQAAEHKSEIEGIRAEHKTRINEIGDAAVYLAEVVRDLQRTIEQ